MFSNSKSLSRIFFFLILSFSLVFPAPSLSADFPQFIGYNDIDLARPDQSVITTKLTHYAQDCGVSVLRLFLPYIGYDDSRGGQFDLTNLKFALQEGSRLGIKFIITLGDSWNNQSDGFYNRDLNLYKKDALATINELKDNYSGAIFAWELLNEPHCNYGGDAYNHDCPSSLYSFVKDFSQEIKDIDPVHPVIIGLISGGDWNTSAWSALNPNLGPHTGDNFATLNSISTIDAAETHFYGDNQLFFVDDLKRSQYLGKPYFVEEYNTHRFDGSPIPDNHGEILNRDINAVFSQGGSGFLYWSRANIDEAGTCQILKNQAQSRGLLPEAYQLKDTSTFRKLYADPCGPISLNNTKELGPDNFTGDPSTIASRHTDPQVTCTFTLPVSQNFDLDQYGSQLQQFNPDARSITVTSLTQNKEIPKEVSNNSRQRIYCSQVTNFSTAEFKKSEYTSLYQTVGTGYKVLSKKQLDELKFRQIVNAAYAHTTDKNNHSTADEIIGYTCPGQTCLTPKQYSKTTPPDCRPVYSTEIAYAYPSALISPYPADATAIINDFYQNRLSSFSPIADPSCYQNLYNLMSITSTTSLQSQIDIHNTDGTVTKNRAIAGASAVTSSHDTNLNLISYRDQQQQEAEFDPQKFCQTQISQVKKPDQVPKVSFIARLLNLFKTVTSSGTVTENVEVTISWPESYAKAIYFDSFKNRQFLPYQKSASTQNIPQSSCLNQENCYPDPGFASSSTNADSYKYPASWQPKNSSL